MPRFFLLFVCLTTLLFSDEDFEKITQATTEGDPSALIEGCVSAITGSLFISNNDIVAPGKEPTYFGKNYINMLKYMRNNTIPHINRRDKYSGWEHFSHIYAYVTYDQPFSKHNRRLDIYEPSGVRQSYSFQKHHKEKKKKSAKFQEWKHGTTRLSFHIPDGMTKDVFVNTSRGQISAKTNYKNNVVEKAGDRRIRVKCVDGTIRNYIRHKGGDERYWLDNEILPNGNRIHYEMAPKWFHPKLIKSLSPTNKTYSSLSIDYHRDEKKINKHREPYNEKVSVVTHNNKNLNYLFDVKEPEKDLKYFVLKSINSHFGQFNIESSYHKAYYLDKYRFPQNRNLIFTYYLGNPSSYNDKKVCDIRMAKSDSEIITTHHLEYQNGLTIVTDGNGHETKYLYDSDYLKLNKIERYQCINGAQHLKNTEQFIWGKNNQSGFLVSKIIYDENSQPIKSERYEYDSENKGNIVKKITFGNITNTNPLSIQRDPDDLPILNGVDTNIEEYTYTENDSIKSEKKQNGLTTEYTYLTSIIAGETFHTTLPLTKFIKHNDQIKQRTFYTYDQDNILIEEIFDDGTSSNKTDFTNVSRRLIKRYQPRQIEPYGLTHTYEELYLDLESGTERLIKREVYDYSIDCNVIRKDVYGSDEKLKYTLRYSYDEKDNLLIETDPLNREANYRYDESNNKIYEKDFSGKETYFEYDNCNRLIKKIIKANSRDYIEEYAYDAKHQKIHEKDIYGNSTYFEYDSLGNQTKQILPPLQHTFANVQNPIINFKYDALGRQIEKQDAEGHITHTSYNIFDKPTIINHPDGTQERFFYNLDTTLNTYINQLGTKTKYEYDYQQRVISKKIYSPSDEFLQDEYFEYSAFELVSKKDSDGNITKYTYDKAGRKIKEDFFSNESQLLSKEEDFYDPLGFIEKKIQADELITIYELDNVGRIQKEKKLNKNNQLLTKIRYEYDNADNNTKIISYITSIEDNIRKDRKVYEIRSFDIFKRLIKTTDPYGYETTIFYEDNPKQKTTQNPLHQKIISAYDALNRETTIKHTTYDGKILSFEEKFYDFNNNLTRQVSHIYNNLGQELRTITTLWQYNSMNRPISITEAYNTNDEKTTKYIYQNGILHETIKPDNTILKYKYDSLSNQIELKSFNDSENEKLPNKKIHYRFSYNKLNQLIYSEDVISNKVIQRTYDAKNHLLKEKQANGLLIKNEYDLLGNKIKCYLPDQSFIQYFYDPINLKKVVRTLPSGETYEHEYTLYDLSQNLLQEKLIKNAGFIDYHIDKLQRVLIVDTPYHSQNITYDEISRISKIRWQKFLNDENYYLYDDLNQITEEKGLFSNNYTFDSNFNRLSKNEDLYEINELNEILSTTQKTFEYDKNGNPISKKSNNADIKYYYDDLDRLIKIETNEYILEFKYDSFNRRISKKVLKFSKDCFSDGTFQENSFSNFLYDEQNEIGSFDKNLIHKELRILGNTKKAEIGSAISFEIGNLICAPIYDISGNVTSLIYGGVLLEHYRYSAFGEEKIFDGYKYEHEDSNIINPWRFSSKRIDKETNLVYYGRRYYDPELGRWLTPDPQGFTDGLNLYVFVQNDPLINVDLYGLMYIAHQPNPLFYKAMDEFLDLKPTQSFNLKMPDIFQNKRIYYTNGIYNSLHDARQSSRYLSKMANNSNIYAIYNEHVGVGSDIARAGMSLNFGVQTKASKLMAKEWMSYLDQDKKNEILQICHSEGNINTRNALRRIPESYRQRINVVGIAPVALISKKLAKSVVQYASKRDKISNIGDHGIMQKYRNNVITLDPHPDAHFIDHDFMSPTYAPFIEANIKNFLK